MSNAWDFQRSSTSARQHRHTRLLPRERSWRRAQQKCAGKLLALLAHAEPCFGGAGSRQARACPALSAPPAPSRLLLPSKYLFKGCGRAAFPPSLPTHALISCSVQRFPRQWSCTAQPPAGGSWRRGGEAPCQHGLSAGKAGEARGRPGSNAVIICVPGAPLGRGEQGSVEAGLCFPTGVCQR